MVPMPNSNRTRPVLWALATAIVAVSACSGGSTQQGAGAKRARPAAPSTTTAPRTAPRTTLVGPRPPAAPSTARPPTPAVVPGAAPVTVAGVFAVGDSVMLGAASQLRAKGIVVDAAQNRQWNSGIALLRMHAVSGTLPRVVVVHLGNNGAISPAQLDTMLRLLAGRRVVLVNAHEQRSWQRQVNDTLREGVARWPGTALLDWDAAGAARPEWFWGDGIHLRPQGAQAYADLVAKLAA
jgi:lysophospholipase L1-like esterase